MAKKRSPLQRAKDNAWKACSLYIRLRDADWRGNCTCVTCGKVGHYKTFQAGHFVPGRRNAVLFDVRNIHSQCFGCNMRKGGNLYWYGKFMEKKYGQKVIDELFELNKENVKYTIEDYQRIEQEFKELTKQYE